jgi:UDP-N-acetylmuramoylalanine--D-glutamate ligase
MDLANLENKNIHIVGITGAEGSAVLLFLHQYLKNSSITSHDFCKKSEFKKNFNSFHDGYPKGQKKEIFHKLSNLPIQFNFNRDYLNDIKKADIIFVPQSWYRYKENKELIKLQKKIPFYNITKLYFNLAPCPIIAVTGTSGKSTTTRMIYEILEQSDKRVYFTGNDRLNEQVLENIYEIKPEDLLVIEVSNRQLKIDMEKSPHIGVITNIIPSHLDDHDSFEDYIKVKKSLLNYQTSKDFAVLNYDKYKTRKISEDCNGRVYFFSSKESLNQGCFIKNNNIVLKNNNREYIICSVLDLKVPGPHNIENALAATLSAYLAGIGTKYIREGIIEYKGIKSRLELFDEIDGVKYYEDSSACNPDGPKNAVQSFKSPIILIAGGARKVSKTDEFSEMAKALVESNVKAVFLIGEKAQEIEDAIRRELTGIKNQKLLVKKCADLEEAVKNSYNSSQPGDVVVLSPGCESFDMFKDYRDRAVKFKRLVRSYKN